MTDEPQVDFPDDVDLQNPPFAVSDRPKWDEWVKNNSDGFYGECVLRYAASWAHLMEQAMADGKEFEDVADELGHEADKPYGITGYQYGCVVGLLTTCWEHGERLRHWHNLKIQIQDEGEKANEKEGAVLNPALLNIRT